MMDFDVRDAIARVYDLAEPGSPVFVDGIRLVFEACGWHYLHDYAENNCGPDVVRRMLVHVAESEASFAQWASRAAGRKNGRGTCSPAAFSGEVVDAITKSRKEERC